MSSTPGEEPARPPISADVAARVEQAERLRSRVVKSLLLVGSITFAAGLIPSALAARGEHSMRALGLALLLAGLLILFPTAALAALLVGPTWRQRQDHWQLLHWETRHQATALAAKGSRRDMPRSLPGARSDSGTL